MPRRRVYILNLEDLLREPPAPSRVLPFLRLFAIGAAILGFGMVFVRFLAPLLPDDVGAPNVVTSLSYSMVVLLFFSLAKRINHV